MKQYDTGLKGEQIAEKYLSEKGMLCIARRYRAQDGEIDLVMRDNDFIVMVEVKYRPQGRSGEGLMAVTPAKQRRMLHAAQSFLVEMEWNDYPVRFDVVEITATGIIHVPNAFIPGA